MNEGHQQILQRFRELSPPRTYVFQKALAHDVPAMVGSTVLVFRFQRITGIYAR